MLISAWQQSRHGCLVNMLAAGAQLGTVLIDASSQRVVGACSRVNGSRMKPQAWLHYQATRLPMPPRLGDFQATSQSCKPCHVMPTWLIFIHAAPRVSTDAATAMLTCQIGQEQLSLPHLFCSTTQPSSQPHRKHVHSRCLSDIKLAIWAALHSLLSSMMGTGVLQHLPKAF